MEACAHGQSIGLSLSRKTLKAVGVRPLVLGVVLWPAMGLRHARGELA